MTSGPNSDVQRAIDYLTTCAPNDLQGAKLSDWPCYESLAQAAHDRGHDLSPDSLRTAFQLMMRARLFTQQRNPPNE